MEEKILFFVDLKNEKVEEIYFYRTEENIDLYFKNEYTFRILNYILKSLPKDLDYKEFFKELRNNAIWGCYRKDIEREFPSLHEKYSNNTYDFSGHNPDTMRGLIEIINIYSKDLILDIDGLKIRKIDSYGLYIEKKEECFFFDYLSEKFVEDHKFQEIIKNNTLENLVKKNKHKLVRYNQAKEGYEYMSVFNYSNKYGGTLNSFQYYNDYVIELGKEVTKELEPEIEKD